MALLANTDIPLQRRRLFLSQCHLRRRWGKLPASLVTTSAFSAALLWQLDICPLYLCWDGTRRWVP